ncbi:MAG: DUF4124 domain-containing protein [Gammaproteobacteria bacterium]|nr:MAG: DUF4124 domain-containing protein [Gammaproteobacteria bacterium]
MSQEKERMRSFFIGGEDFMKQWRYIGVLFVCLLAMPAMAGGIYKCVGANGKTSFSQEPCPDSSITGNTPAHQLWRTLRGMAKEGKVFGANLEGSIESIQQCQAATEAYRARLDALKKEARAVALKHPHIYKAHEQLYDCAQCRFSAIAFCEKADTQLNEAMGAL